IYLEYFIQSIRGSVAFFKTIVLFSINKLGSVRMWDVIIVNYSIAKICLVNMPANGFIWMGGNGPRMTYIFFIKMANFCFRITAEP
ncbi:hypothetical protein ACJX0J_029059, partial [Zea mays]